MRVTKAVIPAAGLGTRTLPATKNQPKEMLPILDKPTIQYIVEEAVASGITEIHIVTRAGKHTVQDHFTEPSREIVEALTAKGKTDLLRELDRLAEIDISYSFQNKPRGLGDAVLRAKAWVGNSPFVVMLGDDVVHSTVPCTKQLCDVYNDTGRSVIAVEHVAPDRISSYGIVGVGGHPNGNTRAHNITKFVEKPKREDAPSDLGILGRYVFTPTVFKHLETTGPGYGNEIQLTDAMQSMLKEEPMVAYEFVGVRHDVGNPFDWLHANIDEALRRPEYRSRLLALMDAKLSETRAVVEKGA